MAANHDIIGKKCQSKLEQPIVKIPYNLRTIDVVFDNLLKLSVVWNRV